MIFNYFDQPLLPISHLPKQNQAEVGIPKIKVNPTQLSYLMDPLYIVSSIRERVWLFQFLEWP